MDGSDGSDGLMVGRVDGLMNWWMHSNGFSTGTAL
jgi:hypothetical protein